MNEATKLTLLRSIPLFAEVKDDDLGKMARRMTERCFSVKDVVLREGEPGEELFVVLEGEFRVVLRQEVLDYERELARLGPGSYFGEVATLTGQNRMATVVCIAPGRVLALHRSFLAELLGQAPELALALFRGLGGYLAQARRSEAAVPFTSLDRYPDLGEAHKLLPPRVSTLCRALAIERRGELVTVALVDPQDAPARAFLRNVLARFQVNFVAISEHDFERNRNLLIGQVLLHRAVPEPAFDGRQGPEAFGDHEAGKIFQEVLGRAVQLGASDVHFEPGAVAGRVRLRLVGRLVQLRDDISLKQFQQIVSRLKVMSDLNIAEKRLPQDGRFALLVDQTRLDIRVSVVPCLGGEKVLLRLHPVRDLWELEELFLSRPVADLARDLFWGPSGLVLVCGPTGAGKTTTLYAALYAIWKRLQAINIVTAEDPVERRLDFATQIGVNRAVGLDFPNLLRSILRQDPDVLLIGEVRDAESAALTLEAATTGHLVLSSLHADSALEAVTRLRGLQVQSHLLAAVLRGVISQRLLSRVCRFCAQEVPSQDENVKHLKVIGVLPEDWTAPIYRGTGCESCHSQGEVGRVAAFEILTVTREVRECIEVVATQAGMVNCLSKQNFISLRKYCRYLLTEGLVAPEQVRSLFPAQHWKENVGDDG